MASDIRNDYLDSIKRAQASASAYYNSTSDSLITDEQYDEQVEQIAQLGDKHGWTEHLPLIQEVAAGTATIPDNEKVTHSTQMLSLKKAQNHEELDAFVTKLGFSEDAYVIEPKLDGLALSLIYTNGKLTRAATRGDSKVGQDVTRQIKLATAAGLPLNLLTPDTFEVRGELFITTEDLAAAQPHRIEATTARKKDGTLIRKGEPYKNGRNAVSGAIQSKSGTDLNYLKLTFAAYDAQKTDQDNSLTTENSYKKRLSLLDMHGFITAASLLPDEVTNHKTILKQVNVFGELRKDFNIPTDGIVVKLDSQKDRNTLGHGSRHPHWAIAYKYEAEIVTTTLNTITREVGRTGAISYTANVTPVEVDGSRVSKATLNNSQFITTLDLRIGDTVQLRKANDIIPEIIGTVLVERPAESKPYIAPTTCPTCNKQLDTTTSVIWRCTNPECSQTARISYAVSSDLLDIDGLSGKIIELLVAEGKIKDVTDLYQLTVKDISNTVKKRELDGTPTLTQKGEPMILGETVGAKLHAAIQASKKQPLPRILSSLGIRFLGRTFGRRLASHFKSFDKIVEATPEQLQQVEGVKEKAHIMAADFAANKTLIEKYRTVGFEALNISAASTTNSTTPQTLTGQSIVVTGSVPGYSRTGIKDLIEEHGGNSGSSVSAKTTFLVAPADERTSSKAKKAQDLKIRIITPEDFLALLGK